MTRLLLTILLFLSSGSAYAEWMWIDDKAKDGMTTYANPDTIRRKGDYQVKVWALGTVRLQDRRTRGGHHAFIVHDAR